MTIEIDTTMTPILTGAIVAAGCAGKVMPQQMWLCRAAADMWTL